MSGGIVVGLDDSSSAQAALAWAAKHARLTNAPLRAVAVLDWAKDVGGYGYTWDVLGDVGGDLESEARVQARRMRDLFDAIGPEPGWSLDFVGGPKAGPVLVEASDGADLLVVGTREHTGIDRLMVGSVSHYCIGHARCPVVTVSDQSSGVSAQSTVAAEQSTVAAEQSTVAAEQSTVAVEERIDESVRQTG